MATSAAWVGLPDAEVVARVLDGDGETFAVLVERYRRAFGQYASGVCGDPDVAADAMQEAFIRAFEALDTCRDPERFGAWFFRILTNQCHNHRTRRRVHQALETVTLREPRSADDRLRDREIREAIAAALDELSPQQRDAFVLREIEGRAYAEMAELLDEREDTLRMRVHRARDAVRRRLEATV